MKNIKQLLLGTVMAAGIATAMYNGIFTEKHIDLNNDGRKDVYHKNLIDNNYTVRLRVEDNRYYTIRNIDSSKLVLLKNINFDSVSRDSLENILQYKRN